MTTSIFFESVPDGTLGFQIQNSGFGLIHSESFLRMDSLQADLKCFSGSLSPKKQKIHFYLVNTRMRSKQDIKMGRLCTPGGAVLGIVGGGDVPFFKW